MCLAGEILEKPHANLNLLKAPLPDEEGKDQKKHQNWDHKALLPVRVMLRVFAAEGLPPAGEDATAGHVLQFIEKELGEALQDYAPVLRNELLYEGGLVMFDGLDEVPEADRRREQIKQAVEEFAATFKKCRILVTSRTYAYQNQDWRLRSFSEAVLAPFSEGQIRRYVDRWYHHYSVLQGMQADEAEGNAELLKKAIFWSERLKELAERPLLLTLMASLHASRGRLPERREALYADASDLLLEWWQQRSIVKDKKGEVKVIQHSLQEYLKIGPEKIRKAIEEVAFDAHAKQPDLVGTADIPGRDLSDRLTNCSEDKNVMPKQLMEFLSHRAGLLVSHGVDVYTFVHRTFQEYMAACHLTGPGFPKKAAELSRDDPGRWREVVLLTGAKVARGAAYSMWALVQKLCFCDPSDSKADLKDLWGAHLAGLLLAETADPGSLANPDEDERVTLNRVRGWLVRILEEDLLPAAVERVAAGNSLARIGDPRFRGKQEWHLPAEDRLGFVKIPDGPFIMGSDKKKGSLAENDELPQKRWNCRTTT